jgi:dimethylargininase
MVRNEGDRLKKVIVCSPEYWYFKVNDLSTHNFKAFPDPERAKIQHDKLKSIISNFGSEVIDIEELQSHPNSVFTRDTSICTLNGYVKLRMGLDSRKGEGKWMSEILDKVGENKIGTIKEPGTIEGGDIILGGNVAFVGISCRSNKKGVEQISRLLEEMDYEVRKINLPEPFLHIGGVMSLIDEKCILCCEGVFKDGFFNGFEIIEIPSRGFISGNVITLGDREVIVEISNQPVIEKLNEKGFKVHTIDLSEFVKGWGGPSCLILPVDRE